MRTARTAKFRIQRFAQPGNALLRAIHQTIGVVAQATRLREASGHHYCETFLMRASRLRYKSCVHCAPCQIQNSVLPPNPAALCSAQSIRRSVLWRRRPACAKHRHWKQRDSTAGEWKRAGLVKGV